MKSKFKRGDIVLTHFLPEDKKEYLALVLQNKTKEECDNLFPSKIKFKFNPKVKYIYNLFIPELHITKWYADIYVKKV